jgi:rubredoxin
MNEARSSAAPYDKEEKGEKGEKRAAESKVEQQPVKRACDQCHSRKVKVSGHASWSLVNICEA